MRVVTALIARPRDACWNAFVEPATLPRWVPGLRSATPREHRVDGLAEVIRFEYAAGLHYSLRYTYDTEQYVARWELVEEQRGGVRGFARFDEVEGGTQLTYGIEHDAGRKAAERALDDPDWLTEAFARFMHDERDAS